MRKKVKLFVLMSLVFVAIFSSGCGKTELESASITRDDARTGGSLSFVYNADTRKIYVGGEGEVVQYSSANESLGFDEGCRVGLKITAPDEELDLSTATLEMNDIKYAMGNFLEKINDKPQRFFNIYPAVSKQDDTVEFSITWQEKTKEQNYKLIIVSGTKFMDKEGNVE